MIAFHDSQKNAFFKIHDLLSARFASFEDDIGDIVFSFVFIFGWLLLQILPCLHALRVWRHSSGRWRRMRKKTNSCPFYTVRVLYHVGVLSVVVAVYETASKKDAHHTFAVFRVVELPLGFCHGRVHTLYSMGWVGQDSAINGLG